MKGIQKMQKIFLFLICGTLFLIFLFLYNKDRILAREIMKEVPPFVCEKGELKNPTCYSMKCPDGKIECPMDLCPGCDKAHFGVCCCEMGENELEIPIGRATDQAEYLAEKIIAELSTIIENTNQESKNALEMAELSAKCGKDPYDCTPHCQSKEGGFENGECLTTCPAYKPYECNENTYCTAYCPSGINCCSEQGKKCCCQKESLCEAKPCSGNACPPEINTKMDEIKSLASAIEKSDREIEGYLKEMEEVFEKLQKSRTRLADCVTRPYQIESLERGEVTGKFLLDCQDILDGGIPIHSILDEKLQEGCYGNTYCQVKVKEKGEEVPYPPPPCAEDYYCCY